MTLLLPGSAQLASGNRHVGRLALRVWSILVVLIMGALLLFFVNRGALVAIVTFAPIALAICTVMVLCGIGWAVLMIDAWRISRPPELARGHRFGFGLLALVLAIALSGALFASASVVRAETDFVGSVFRGGGETGQKDGRYNILLLGGDAGSGREGLRPDSLTVASVDAKTGRTVLFSLPRNLEEVEFPAGSPMKRFYPDKFDCPGHECLLNAVYTRAMEHKDLYPGVKDPGAQATKEVVEWVTGLDINYYALIDLNGFESLIDAVGGIRMDVHRRVPIGGGSSPVIHYIEPGKGVYMNGRTALWFARSRHDSTDYERMARQKCVMHAMLNQLDPMTVLTKFQSIANAGKQIVETDVPPSEMDRLVDLSLKTRQTKVSSVSFVPPLVSPGSPDFTLIRQTVKARIAGKPTPVPSATAHPIAESSASATPSPSGRTRRTPTPTQTQSPSPTPTSPSEADTEDLGAVCSA